MKPDNGFVAFAAALLALAATMPAFGGAKYCLNPSSGGSSCGFTSLEQCRETMRGRNGWCSEQVDFDAWTASHGQSWSGGNPANSFAYYPPGGTLKGHRAMPAVPDLEKLHKDDMPSKGVGAE